MHCESQLLANYYFVKKKFCGIEQINQYHLCHLFSVGFGIEGSFCEKYWMFLWGNTKFIVESVMPDFLHIIPVCDDTVFDGVFEGKDTSLGLGFISYIGVLLPHANHNSLMIKIKKL